MHEEDLRIASRKSFEEEEIECIIEEKKEYRHEMVLEMKLRSEERDLWRIIGSISNYRGDRSATMIDDVARVFL